MKKHRMRYYAVLGAILMAAVGLWGWRAYRAAPLRELPPLDLSQAHAAVAEAIEHELTAVRAAPRSGRAWGRLGLVLRAHEFGSQANACLAVAERLESREFLWPYIAGVSLSLTDPNAAMAAFRRAARLHPTDPLPNFRLGELLLQQGRTEEAARQFEKALAIEPDSARGRVGLARCALLNGDVAEGKRLAVEAARLSPGKREPYDLAIQICHRLGDEDGARAAEEVLAQLPPGETRWEDAHVAQVLKLRRDPRWLADSAQEAFDHGHHAEAISLFAELVDADDADPRWKVMLAQALIAARDYAGAAAAIERGIARHADSAELQLQLGILAFREREWQKAADAFRKTARLQPDSSQAFYNLGHALKQLNDSPAAIGAFQEAVRLQPNLAAAHANLGELLVQSGRRDEGLVHLHLAVKLDPSDASARRSLEEADR